MTNTATTSSVVARETNRAPLLFGAIAVVSLVGLADATYLTILHISGATARCTVLTGCSEVLGSSYASVGGFPLALLGAAAYFTVFSLAVLCAFGYRVAQSPLVALVASMALVSIGLVAVQAFVIGAFCEFCLLSAGVSFTLAALVILARRAARS